MPSHIDHVIGAAQNEVITVLVANAPVKGAVHGFSRHAVPVGADKACVVLPDGLHEAGRRGAFNDDDAFFVRLGQLFAGGFVEQFDGVAIHRHPGTAEFARFFLHAVGDGDDGPARFGLPVVVDDGHPQAIADPAGGGLVQRFTGQEKRTQAAQVVFFEQCRVLLFQHPHRCGRAEHGRDLVFFDQAPPDAAIGLAVHPLGRQALVQDRCHAGDQRAIDDVAVPHHPADVAGRKKGFTRLDIKNVRHAGRQCHGIATGVALHALGFARGAAGVDGVADVGRMHRLARHLGVQMHGTQVGPKLVTPSHQRHRRQAAIHHQHRIGLVGRQANGGVQQRFVRHHLAAARPGIGGHDDLGRGVINARRQRAAGKAAKHHAVNRANAGASQHGERGLGNHRHVNQHAVTLADAHGAQTGRHALHFQVQLGKAVRCFQAGFARHINQCRLIGSIF